VLPAQLRLDFSIATTEDAADLAALVNQAYRGEVSKSGWTTEADLIAGLRTDSADILRLLSSKDSLFLVCKAEGRLLASLHVQREAQAVHIGMFAVSPFHQGQGIGKQLLQFAEQCATQIWQVEYSRMSVIPLREELIAFYQRRGYRRTGICKPFPENPAVWQAKVPGLSLELLEKRL
jgi:ribosomal protein S18 acetylase RimI-like enzyme